MALHWSNVSARKARTPLSQHHSTWLKRDQSRAIGQHLPARRAWEVMTRMPLAEGLGQGTADLGLLPTTSEVSASPHLCSLLRAHGEGVL